MNDDIDSSTSAQQPAPPPGGFVFRPTHTVPAGGLDAWTAPTSDAAPVARLDPWLDVQVTQREQTWARIVCANGWSGWVDHRDLVERVATTATTATTAATRGNRRLIFQFIGLGVAVVATILPWVRPPPVGSWRIPVAVLWESGGLEGGGMTLGLLVLLIAFGAGGYAMSLRSAFGSRFAGGMLLAVAGIFLARAFSSAGTGAFRVLGMGPFLLILAGLAFIVAPDMDFPIDSPGDSP